MVVVFLAVAMDIVHEGTLMFCIW